MYPARSRADAAKARVAMPSAIRHCDPSVFSAPVSSREIRFDNVGSAPRFVIRVISAIRAAARCVFVMALPCRGDEPASTLGRPRRARR